jgi:hypothetical protein
MISFLLENFKIYLFFFCLICRYPLHCLRDDEGLPAADGNGNLTCKLPKCVYSTSELLESEGLNSRSNFTPEVSQLNQDFHTRYLSAR